MLPLVRKEINIFLSSITGYVVIIVFLVANSLFMWVFPGELNILDSGYATLDTLFLIAPWVFLFLVPAVTMKMFAEEKRSGTLELLLTWPVSDLQIIMAKFLSGVILVLFSLLPALVYYYSVYQLGSPPGNLDTGGVWGSFAGLFFLASAYVAIGIFASSITDNQIVAFITAVIISFFFYIGFDSIASLPLFSNTEEFIVYLGINEHYRSMSRGVIDTRDVIYFVSLMAVFILITRVVLQSRRW